MDDKDKQIRELRKSTAKDLEILLEAQEQGLIPLFFFIETVASEPAINKLKKGITLPKLPKDHLSKAYPPKVYPFKGVINLEGLAKEVKLFELEHGRQIVYLEILQKIKKDILSDILIVRAVETSLPLNDFRDVRLWCTADDTLKSPEDTRPNRRIALKVSDAISWLNNNGMPVPDWLVSMTKNDRSDSSLNAPDKTSTIPLKKNTKPRRVQIDKARFQGIAKVLWENDPSLNQTEILKSEEMEFHRRTYKGKNTLSNWLKEIDPRPKESRRGRPKNTRQLRK